MCRLVCVGGRVWIGLVVRFGGVAVRAVGLGGWGCSIFGWTWRSYVAGVEGGCFGVLLGEDGAGL